MTERETLIELLDEGLDRINRGTLDFMLEILADHLLANGVVVREWIPVTERLPEDGEICICFDSRIMAILQWDERADRWLDFRRAYPKTSVTHWMPLPEPPKEEV